MEISNMQNTIYKFLDNNRSSFVSQELRKNKINSVPTNGYLQIEGSVPTDMKGLIADNGGKWVSTTTDSKNLPESILVNPSDLQIEQIHPKMLSEDHVPSTDKRRWTGGVAGKGKYVIIPSELKHKKKLQYANDTHCIIIDPTTGGTVLVPFVVKQELPAIIVKEEEKPADDKKEKGKEGAAPTSIETAVMAILKKAVDADPKKFPKLAAKLGAGKSADKPKPKK